MVYVSQETLITLKTRFLHKYLASGHKCYKDGNVQLLSTQHKKDRVIFATKMSRVLHERGQEILDLVWHSDEKVFRLEWNDNQW